MSNAFGLRACRRCRASQRRVVDRRLQVTSLISSSVALERNFLENRRVYSTSTLPSDTTCIPKPHPRRQPYSSNSKSPSPTIQKSKSLNLINDKIQQWLQVPAGKWTAREVASGQYLMEECLKHGSNKGVHMATRVLKRWIRERHKRERILWNSQLLEHLHRVLHAWKLHGRQEDRPGRIGVLLLYDLEEACLQHKNVPPSQFPGNKAYSMTFQLLATFVETDTFVIARQLLNRWRLTGIEPDLLLWQSCLNAFAKCSPYQSGAVDIAEEILQEMNLPPDQVCFATVLNAWSKSCRPGAAQRAQDILEKMLLDDSPVKPNNVCINTCIDAWAKSGESDGAQRAENLLRRMEEQSRQPGKGHLQPDSVAYSTVVHAWAKSSHPKAAQHAENLFIRMQQMSQEGKGRVEADKFTLGSVLDAWARSTEPGAAKRAESFLNRMEESHRQGKLKIEITAQSYTSVLHAWANSHDKDAADNAERILKLMEDASKSGRKEIAPTRLTYTTAIQALSRCSDKNAPSRALAILRRMEQVGIAPETFTFNAAISVCAKHGEISLASDLFDEMCHRSDRGEPHVSPTTHTYASMINACARGREPELAMKLLGEMETIYEEGNEYVRPNVIAYTSAITAWKRIDDSDAGNKAEAILWRMMDKYHGGNEDARPNAVAVSAVMQVWMDGGEAEAPEKVESLLEWMKKQYASGDDSVKPMTAHYNLLLETWAKSRRYDSVPRIESILKTMAQDFNEHVHPNKYSYNMLLLAIRNSSERNKPSRSLKVLQGMIESYRKGNSGVKPSRYTFHLLLQIIIDSGTRGEREEAALALRDAFREFAETDKLQSPTPSTYALLMNACKALGDAIDPNLFELIRRYCTASNKVRWKAELDFQSEHGKYFWNRKE